jgi:predicted nucleic acid-binding protein
MSERYVLDANVLIQAYVLEEYTRRVQTLLQALVETDTDEFNIPEFCLLECTNVLWKHVRLHGMPVETAQRSITEMRFLPLMVHKATDLLPRAFDIGLLPNLAIYDAIYIALAEQLRCPLITADVKQANVAASIGVTIKPITDFPEFTEPE